MLFHMGHHDEDFGQSAATNKAMVEELGRSSALKSAECTAAFMATDRGHFWTASIHGSGSPELVYADMPLRTGRLHLSAPHIYAKALESLMPLRSGMSFLNVGSGTGYFNSIVAELTGDMGTNHGIDIWPETIDHARERCRLRAEAAGRRSHIEFYLGNVYELDVNYTTRYDRIYLGACANSRSKYLYRLLEVGGILIGPFQSGHSQQLRRVVRASETQFNVEILGSVQFANLIEPPPVPRPLESIELELGSPESGSSAQRDSIVSVDGIFEGNDAPDGIAINRATTPTTVGLPDVPFKFNLLDQPWTVERCWLFPASYKRVVGMSLRCRPRDPSTQFLPSELWINHIFPWCSKGWFEQPSEKEDEEVKVKQKASLEEKRCEQFLATPRRKGVENREDDVSDDGCVTEWHTSISNS
jgi:protein-L-isoaspartate O-methyltransferase